jgi:hypothetical protein
MRTTLHNNLFTLHKGYSPTAVSKNRLCTHAWVLNKCVFKLSFSVLTRNNNYRFYIFFDVANNIDIVMKGKCLITKSFKVQVFTTSRHYETALFNHVLCLGIRSNVILQLLQQPSLSSSIAVLHVFVLPTKPWVV